MLILIIKEMLIKHKKNTFCLSGNFQKFQNNIGERVRKEGVFSYFESIIFDITLI